MVALVIYHENGDLSIIDDDPLLGIQRSLIDFDIWDTFDLNMPVPFVYCC
jgi:hypothetical protein